MNLQSAATALNPYGARHRAHPTRGLAMPRKFTVLVLALALVMQVLSLASNTAHAVVGPVGNGFTVTAGDLSFILKQIKIAERHATTFDAAQPCSTLLHTPGAAFPDPEHVPDIITSYGLRTVDGSCNNLKTGDEKFAAADQVFPRLTSPVWRAPTPPDGPFPVTGSATYEGTDNVVDAQPRVVSNLIVDQTSTNPAALAASGHPVRSQDPTASSVPCDA